MKTDNEKAGRPEDFRNRLIAEFMKNDAVNSPHLKQDNELQYATSWDWLMPVVEKISSLQKDWPKATDNLLTLGISTPIIEVYKEVRDFIHWYNSVKGI